MKAQHRQTPGPRAFTLLEVVLAMLLATVLLAAVWVAVRMELRFFEAGRSEVEQAQLARALLDRIRADLHNGLLPPSPPPAGGSTPGGEAAGSASGSVAGSSTASDSSQAGPADPASPSSASEGAAASPAPDALGTSEGSTVDATGETAWPRRGHFTGTSKDMLFDVRLPPESLRWQAAQAIADPASTTAAADAVPTVVNLATVRYRFVPGDVDTSFHDASAHDAEPTALQGSLESREQHGLLRWEIPWSAEAQADYVAQLPTESDATLAAASTSGPSSTAAGRDGSGSTSPFASGAPGLEPADGQPPPPSLVTPEVAAVEFRYFDGVVWHSTWDSRSAGSWPLAVRVAIRFAREEPDAPADAVTTEPPPLTEDATLNGAPGDPLFAEEPYWDYQLLIRLPAVPAPRVAPLGPGPEDSVERGLP